MNDDVVFEKDFKFICEHFGSFLDEENRDGTCTRRYVKHPEALNFLHDTLKALRLNEFFAIRLMAQWNTLKNHLLPLLIAYQHDASLTFQIIHVLTKITMPIDSSSMAPEDVFPLTTALYAFKEELCERYDSVSPFGVIMSLVLLPLANYEKDLVATKQAKRASTRHEITRTPSSSSDVEDDEKELSDIEEREIEKSKMQSLETSFALERREKHLSERDMQFIELVLTLVRNVLAISEDTLRVTTAALQPKMIACLDDCCVYELLFTLFATFDDRKNKSFKFLLMEIIYRTFSGLSPEKLLQWERKKQVGYSHNFGFTWGDMVYI
jgi:hypothetical protein